MHPQCDASSITLWDQFGTAFYRDESVGRTLVPSSPRMKCGRINLTRFGAAVALPKHRVSSPVWRLSRHRASNASPARSSAVPALQDLVLLGLGAKGRSEMRVSSGYLSVLYSWFINTSAICSLSSWIYYFHEVMFGCDLRGYIYKNCLLILFFHSICRLLSSGRRPTSKTFHNVSKISAP